MERENMKGKIALTVISAATLLVALMGATFAYFSATSESEKRTITTSNLNLTVAADGAATHVTNIKPTTWSATMSENTSNSDIAKIPFKVTGTSSTNGTYTVNLQTSIAVTTTQEQPDGSTVTLEGGEIGDIKYKLYKADGTLVLDEQPFAATTDVDIITNGQIVIPENATEVTLNDQYILYVYIKNDSTKPQNKLQEVNFTITLGGSASQTVQQ